MIIMASTLISAINEVRHVTPEELTRDTVKVCKENKQEENTMNNVITFTNCRTYHTGLYKPNTIAIENNQRLISIVYYDRKNAIDKMYLYAIATDEQGNKYDVYRENHDDFIGYLAFPQNPDELKGYYPWL